MAFKVAFLNFFICFTSLFVHVYGLEAHPISQILPNCQESYRGLTMNILLLTYRKKYCGKMHFQRSFPGIFSTHFWGTPSVQSWSLKTDCICFRNLRSPLLFWEPVSRKNPESAKVRKWTFLGSLERTKSAWSITASPPAEVPENTTWLAESRSLSDNNSDIVEFKIRNPRKYSRDPSTSTGSTLLPENDEPSQ